MINFEHIEKELEIFKKYVIQQSRSNLIKKNKKDTGNLFNSIDAEIKGLWVNFLMTDYGEFVDKGVNGVKKKWGSPFSYTNSMPPTSSFDKCVVRKGIAPRDKSGKFINRSSLKFAIAKNIYKNGIKPTMFFTKPFERGFNRLDNELINAFGLDVEEFLTFTINKIK